jgi:hypothetical protein
MLTDDGRQLVTIDTQGTVDLWTIGPSVDTLADPIPEACAHAGLTDQLWQQIVPGTGYPNPCPAVTGAPTVTTQPAMETRP